MVKYEKLPEGLVVEGYLGPRNNIKPLVSGTASSANGDNNGALPLDRESNKERS
jgi:hypothetical protein